MSDVRRRYMSKTVTPLGLACRSSGITKPLSLRLGGALHAHELMTHHTRSVLIVKSLIDLLRECLTDANDTGQILDTCSGQLLQAAKLL